MRSWETRGLPSYGGAILLALAAGGCAWSRWKAVLWLAIVPSAAGSLGADAAWWIGLRHGDQEYEPLPFSIFVLSIWIPACCIAVGLGVAARRVRARRRRSAAEAEPQATRDSARRRAH